MEKNVKRLKSNAALTIFPRYELFSSSVALLPSSSHLLILYVLVLVNFSYAFSHVYVFSEGKFLMGPLKYIRRLFLA